jgi:accessory colonization factor AcfC
MAVAVDSQFFATLPFMEEVDKDEAELAWIVYDLKHDIADDLRHLTLARTVYTRFIPTLDKITKSEPGDVQEFVDFLQGKLNEVLSMGSGIENTPDTASLQDIVEMIE